MPVDQGLAQMSDTLFGISMAVYAAGMLGYAAEFAFSRFGGAAAAPGRSPELAAPAAAAEAAAAVVPERRQALVAAGVGDLPAGARGIGGNAERAENAAALGDGGNAPGGPPPTRSFLARAAAGMNPRTAGSADPAAPARARLAGMAAVVLTVLGWALHTGSVVTRGLAADRVPWGNMYEFSSMICLIAVTAFLLLLARQPVRWLGVFVMVPVVLYLGFAGTVLYVPAGPLVPALNSYWLKIHVAAAIVSSGVFIVSAVTTVLYLLKDRWENRVAEVAAGRADTSTAMRRRGGIVMKLPSAQTLDTLTYRTIALAFPIWTFAVVAGAIWAEAAWGRYWGWDPKETWSFITWVVYAAYLHARTTGGWKGRRAAVVSLVGFSALFIDYYLVNLVISGLHSYSGV